MNPAQTEGDVDSRLYSRGRRSISHEEYDTVQHYSATVFILAGIFDLVLVFILRRKCLIVLVTFESFESFIVLVDEK